MNVVSTVYQILELILYFMYNRNNKLYVFLVYMVIILNNKRVKYTVKIHLIKVHCF